MTTLKHNNDLAIPQGSLILVTGATGHIGANIVREALDAGFRVRGTVRSEEKAYRSRGDHQNNPNYETVLVPDMQSAGVFDEAIKGVDAIIHTASILTFSPDPSKVVQPTVQAAIGIMDSALKEQSVKRFVYTSSSSAASDPKPGEKIHFGKDTWNVESEAYVDLKPPFKEENGFMIYGASKTMAERAVWQFVKEKTPHYVVNSVLPYFNMGRIIGSTGVTGGFVLDTYHGNVPRHLLSVYMIDVQDDARIHIAAAIDKTLANERIFAFDEPFTWNDVLAVLKELKPDQKFVDPDPNEIRDISTADNELGAELLRKWFGQDGYVGLKESVRRNIADESWLNKTRTPGGMESLPHGANSQKNSKK